MDPEEFLSDASSLSHALPPTTGELSATKQSKLKEQAKVVLTPHNPCPMNQSCDDVRLFLQRCIPTQEGNLLSESTAQDSEDSAENNATRDRLNDAQRMIQLYKVHPKLEDYSTGLITLNDKVKLPGPDRAPDAFRRICKRKILLKEQEATHMAKELSERYGSESLFRAAFREFYSTGLVGIQQTFWRVDHRGQRIRRQAEEISLQTINEHLWLNGAEVAFVVRGARCLPQDAMNFWRWVSSNRITYLAVRDMLELGEPSFDNSEDVLED
ncbi:hypothetical protein ACO22_07839 [Paracoccidioides brasiliensis]|uniref:Uncharacterized protein n=1 Tax=Paracoccidioides brasiliensis TaxID=121759 RepID=A0A1D2J3I6_PARBR|nr:hypothetical protein ACO22_07839 [Paracoccidioides brasiliensis]